MFRREAVTPIYQRRAVNAYYARNKEAIKEKKRIRKEIKKLEEEDKNKIKNRHNNDKMTYVIAILLITIIGTALYYNKKKVQYGGNFDSMKFMLGKGMRYNFVK